MRKFFKIFFITLLPLFVIGTFVFLYDSSQEAVESYQLYEVQQMDLSKSTVLTGAVEPRDEILIKPRISGLISEVLKSAGDRVKKGDIIAKVNVIPDMQQVSSAESSVRLAKIAARQAQVDFEREKKLFAEQLVSAEEYEKYAKAQQETQERLKAAQENYEIAQYGVSKSQSNVSNTLVRSTLDGLVLEVPVKVGTSVIKSNSFNDGTTIAAVANMQDLVFRGSIDETEVGWVRKGMPVEITIGALPHARFEAQLEFIAPKVQHKEGSANQYEIRAAVHVPDSVKVRAGYSANAKIVLEQRKNVLAVPENAVKMEGGNSWVYVVEDAAEGKYRRQKVSLGMSDGVHVEITEGLKKGQKVRGGKII